MSLSTHLIKAEYFDDDDSNDSSDNSDRDLADEDQEMFTTHTQHNQNSQSNTPLQDDSDIPPLISSAVLSSSLTSPIRTTIPGIAYSKVSGSVLFNARAVLQSYMIDHEGEWLSRPQISQEIRRTQPKLFAAFVEYWCNNTYSDRRSIRQMFAVQLFSPFTNQYRQQWNKQLAKIGYHLEKDEVHKKFRMVLKADDTNRLTIDDLYFN